MLTTVVAHQSGPRAQAAATRTLDPIIKSSLNGRHCQQTRTFRFGVWASHMNPELRRELRRRHRVLRQRYGDAISQRMPWDQSPVSQEPGFKRLFSRCWHPGRARWSWHFLEQDDATTRRAYASSQSGTSGRPDDRSRFWSEYKDWKFQLDHMVDEWSGKPLNASQKRASHNLSSSEASARSDAGNPPEDSVLSQEDYVIDPITNRKVPRTTFGSVDFKADEDASTFKAYRSQFAPNPDTPLGPEEEQLPIYSDGPPPGEELHKYRSIEIDSAVPGDFSEPVLALDPSAPLATYSSFSAIQTEEYSLNHLPPEDEELPAQPDELAKYKPYMDEAVTAETASSEEPVEEDLAKYASVKIDAHEQHVQDKPPVYKDLHEYEPYLHNEKVVDETKNPTYEDLHEYGPYKHQEDTAVSDKAAAYDDLHKYQPYEYQEAQLASTPEEPVVEDLDKYQPKAFDDFPEAGEDQPFQQYGDLDKYKAFRDQALETEAIAQPDVVEECLKEFDAKDKAPYVEPEIWPESGIFVLDTSEPVCVFDSTEHGVHANNATGSSLSNEELDHSIEVAQRETSAPIHAARLRMEPTKPQEQSMTGNYVRDFPEEFSGPWAFRELAETLEKTREQAVPAEEKDGTEALDQIVGLSKLEPALNRHNKVRKVEPTVKTLNQQAPRHASNLAAHHRPMLRTDRDQYSSEPQGLETSYKEECGDNPAPTFIRSYGTVPQTQTESASKTSQPPLAMDSDLDSYYARDPEIDGRGIVETTGQTATENSNEPTVYRILAYDPTMQNIRTAETTSVVPDQAAPLTPAEALLRLSNPTKFFPYLAPLQAEGFEIVSGAGDVLVFRKVRAALRKINPIDLTGRPMALPNAAAFASPTGFVNYDIPRVEETAAEEPGFRSNIDVRREEPVFSGPKTTTERPKRKSSAMKRIFIGGVWVAGFSYAMGVVAEYFSSGVPGGSDSGRF